MSATQASTSFAADVGIRDAAAADVDAISQLIIETLRVSNARDYPPEIIARLVESFRPDQVSVHLTEREVVVAERDARVVATGSLDEAMIRAVFVAPDAQNKGIGRRVMQELQRRACARSIKTVCVQSSITAERFYSKLGFMVVGERYNDHERTIVMEREP